VTVLFAASSGLGGCGASKRQVDEQSAGTGGSAGAAAGASSAGAGGAVTGGGGRGVAGAPANAGRAPTSTGGAPTNVGGAPTRTGGAPTTDAGAPPLADNPFPCENPTPVFTDASGFVTCDNGYDYRAKVGTCPIMRRDEPVPVATPDDPCLYDADCAEEDPQGYCSLGYCEHGCLEDSECGSDRLCACSSEYGLGTCVIAECRSDADCLPGLHCARIIDGTSDSALWKYACQTEADECVSDDDCPPRRDTETGNCELGEEGRYCL
jgi:hypothetical protein